MVKEIVEEKIEHRIEQKKAEQKKRARRAVCACVGGVCLLCAGYFLGVHHRVIEAYIKGEPLPVQPKGHGCHSLCAKLRDADSAGKTDCQSE